MATNDYPYLQRAAYLHHLNKKIFVSPGLCDCLHVFLFHEEVNPPLTPAYDSAFPAITRRAKAIRNAIWGAHHVVLLDGTKPAYREAPIHCLNDGTQHSPYFAHEPPLLRDRSRKKVTWMDLPSEVLYPHLLPRLEHCSSGIGILSKGVFSS